MKSKFSSPFIFTTCQVGAEPTLKKEIVGDGSQWKFAYSRPGFVTFKNIQGDVPLDFSLDSVFARSYGVSHSFVKEPEFSKILDFAKELAELQPERKLRLHVWERDFHSPGEEPLGFVIGKLAQSFEKRVRALAPDLFDASEVAVNGDLVLDVIVLEEDQVGLGAHVHSNRHSPWPGARTPIELPKNSPSRAYLKLEECLIWSGAPVKSGDTAVEIGSAPGGASLALLNRGLNVVGIDPAEMDPMILKNPKFKHFQQPVNGVLREDLPEAVHWLLLDMNVEPRITLFAVDRLASRMKGSLLGVLLTMKLNQWKIAEEIPQMLEHVKAMGMARIQAAQLSHHRQEILIYGLTRQGLDRKSPIVGPRKVIIKK